MAAQWWTDEPTLLPTTLPPVEYECGYNGTGPAPIEWATVRPVCSAHAPKHARRLFDVVACGLRLWFGQAVGWCVYRALEVASRFLGAPPRRAVLLCVCTPYSPMLCAGEVLAHAGFVSILFWLFAQFPYGPAARAMRSARPGRF